MTKEEKKAAIKSFIDSLPESERVQVVQNKDESCTTIGAEFVLACLKEL